MEDILAFNSYFDMSSLAIIGHMIYDILMGAASVVVGIMVIAILDEFVLGEDRQYWLFIAAVVIVCGILTFLHYYK